MRRRWTVIATACVLTLALAACGNAPTSGSNASGSGSPSGPGTTASAADLQKNVKVDAPGVTDTEIRVGGVVSKTNPIGGNYEPAAEGARAYFEMINSQGGIYGRKINLVKVRDDQVGKNADEVEGLIAQDDVFAVVPVASLVFTGADKLQDAGVPTFGWNINPEWANKPYLFGAIGSYLCFTCSEVTRPWVAKQSGATKVGILGYGISDQSKDCVKGIVNSFEKYKTAEIGYQDAEVPFGADFAVQVNKMKQAGVDFVVSCIDENGTITLAKEIAKQGLKATQYLQNGYSYDLLNKFSDVLQGSVVLVQATPIELEQKPKGLTDYITWIDRTGGQRGEMSQAGWLAAALFVEGLKRAGPEFSRQKVVDGLNGITAWNADEMIADVDWTRAHSERATRDCNTFVRIDNGKFVPHWGAPGKPFNCFPVDPPTMPDAPTFEAH